MTQDTRYDALLLDATDPATLMLYAPAPVLLLMVDILQPAP